MSKDKNVEKIQEIFDENGFTFDDMLCFLGKNITQLLMLPDNFHNRFKAMYDSLNKGNLPQRKKGEALEKITSILFQDGAASIFDVYRNCRTSTNEIDLLIRWTENARVANISRAFPVFGDSFLCECKNYKEKVGVTYVGKFFSLMNVTDTKLGIMISWEGISGRGEWSAAKGLVKKIALRENRYIIVIDKHDLKCIYDKETNIFSLVNDKVFALKNDVNFDTYIKSHEAEKCLHG